MLLNIMDESLIKCAQAIILAALLIVVLININTSHKNLEVKNRFVILIIGFSLGFISSFLGIGGGPINVAVFVFFFNIDMKNATVYSIATILFSQASKLVTIGLNGGFMKYDLSLLLFALPAAILGGIVGTAVNHRSDKKIITMIFNVSVFMIILLNVYNAVNAII